MRGFVQWMGNTVIIIPVWCALMKKELSVFYLQVWQLLLGIISIILFWWALEYIPLEGSLWNIKGETWFWMAILIPIAHQLVIAPFWRMELLNQSLTRVFGSTERAFLFFKILFATFFVPRMLITIPLAISTANSVDDTLNLIFLVIAIILSPVVLYGLYSIKHYFGMNRAFGADHFFESYRSLPIVKEGIFKYTDNAMYTFILIAAWLPGLYLGSLPALIAGIFNQLFVWVHYYTTEKPDMEYIYE